MWDAKITTTENRVDCIDNGEVPTGVKSYAAITNY